MKWQDAAETVAKETFKPCEAVIKTDVCHADKKDGGVAYAVARWGRSKLSVLYHW